LTAASLVANLAAAVDQSGSVPWDFSTSAPVFTKGSVKPPVSNRGI